MDALKIYISAFKKNIKYYYPNRDVLSSVEVGDFGTMKGNHFLKKGNIAESPFNISFRTKEEKLSGNKNFGMNCDVNFSDRGIAKFDRIAVASMQIKFTKKHSAYCNITYSSVSEMQNIIAIEDTIIRLFNEGIWKKEYVIVSTVVKSKNTIIAVSDGNSSEFILSCDTKNSIRLSDTEINYRIAKQTGASYIFATQADHEIIPMFQIMKIYGEGFTPPKKIIPGKSSIGTFDSDDDDDDVDLTPFPPGITLKLNIIP